ncbi:hypothetical protein [Azospirillum argentinense]|uniref:hypothetical protein n=1 Tax=Azospirillum argentinense TaxID=2970906 RepID=UPI001FFF60AA|nr:hypothetical protein [Azospirillum argentinense]
MNRPSDTVIERVKVREVAGIFRSPDALDAAAGALLYGGFDRADIGLMALPDTIREKLGGVYAPAEELADVPDVPRRAYIAHEDVATTTALVAGASPTSALRLRRLGSSPREERWRWPSRRPPQVGRPGAASVP